MFEDVRDRSTIMAWEVKFGAKILPVYSPLSIKGKWQLQSGENASLYVIELTIWKITVQLQYRWISLTLSKKSFILYRVSQNIF